MGEGWKVKITHYQCNINCDLLFHTNTEIQPKNNDFLHCLQYVLSLDFVIHPPNHCRDSSRIFEITFRA